MAGGTCGVCKDAPSKYKCPSCRTPYCSVTCFKNHKEKSCQKISPQEEIRKSSLHEEETGKSSLPEEVTHSCGLQEGGVDCLDEKDKQPLSAADSACPAKSPNPVCPKKFLEVEDRSWLVGNNRLRSIAELNEIRDTVRDPELQKMILLPSRFISRFGAGHEN